MPDYASILRRSISALPDPSPEMREAVYQRARAALARQLTAVDPPLSTREIETQHQELEDAVGRLEAEYASSTSDDPSVFEAPADEQIYYSAPQRSDAVARDGTSKPASGDRDSADDEADEGDEDDFEEEEEDRTSRLPLLIAVGAVVVLVAALAAYGYAKRDAIAGLFGGGDNVEVVSTTPAPIVMPAESQQPEDDPDKQDDRLTNGSEPPVPEAPLAEPVTLPPEAAEAAPAEALPLEPLPVETVPLGEEQTAALQTPTPGEGLVAQRAIYYFQGTEGSPGRAVEGSVTWAEIMRDNAPAVQATLHLAEPEVTTTVTIYRNNDVSLPASHMVEVEFQGALGSTAIQRVPALVLKSTEQARGEPLAGAAVPVTDQLFWIALSNDSDEATRNVTLLREGAWFDIPILFTDGTRALLTFEKGIPGDRIFETVMASWTPT